MAHINLLPWRDQRRELRKREFFGQLAMAAVAGVIVVIAWVFWMGQRIDNQNDRNSYLQGQIKQVDAKIAKIKNLEKVRSQLLARKQIIEKLQSNRSQMVHLFDTLVKTIPDSVRLTSMTQNGQQLSLKGVAQSNASVAGYMKRLAASPWLGAPSLDGTVNHHTGSRMPYTFGFGMALAKPTDEQREAAERKQAQADDSGTVTVTPAATVAAPASTGPTPTAPKSTVPNVSLPVVAPAKPSKAAPTRSANQGEGQS